MASNPPGAACCVAYKHDGDSVGKIDTIAGTETYVSVKSAHEDPKKILIIITDVFGYKFINNQLLADTYASAGFLTVIPDLFDGDAVDPQKLSSLNLAQDWLPKHGIEQIEPKVEAIVRYYAEKHPEAKLYALGHCFGAKYVIRQAANEGRFAAVAIAHPSFTTPEEVEKIKTPILISAAEIDKAYPADKRATTEKILEEIGVNYHTTLTSKVAHGFAVRADPEDKWAVIAKNKSISDAIWWFSLF